MTTFAERLHRHETVLGYWLMLDAPAATERIARVGYDYVVLDGQHGLLGYSGILNGLLAVDAAGGAAGLVRVPAIDAAAIGRALDAGAAGVIVPLINTPEDAAAAVAAAKYPPAGIRSFGPMRSALRFGPDPAVANEETVVLAMIETAQGLENVEAIAATPGLDGLYIGPSDLALGLGATAPGDPSVAEAFAAALDRIKIAAESAGITAGVHTAGGDIAAERLAAGFTLVTIASDLVHLEQVAAAHLQQALGQSPA